MTNTTPYTTFNIRTAIMTGELGLKENRDSEKEFKEAVVDTYTHDSGLTREQVEIAYNHAFNSKEELSGMYDALYVVAETDKLIEMFKLMNSKA